MQDARLTGLAPGLSRRRLLWSGGLLVTTGGLLAGAMRPALARDLPATPRQTEGPFYPVRLPLDHDNDLVRVEGAVREAGGRVTHLSGQVRDTAGRPVVGALVEIWQCDVNGVYRHPRAWRREYQDDGFQGYGRTLTDAAGRYRFRTIRPVPYYGRAPHIHVKATPRGRATLTTQMYLDGHPDNDRDFVLNSLRSAEDRARLMMRLGPTEGVAAPDTLAGRFDIVLPS